ncbi:MAG TPA: hypothetical protein VGG25_19150 [Streptosporangiaceae bacterium]
MAEQEVRYLVEDDMRLMQRSGPAGKADVVCLCRDHQQAGRFSSEIIDGQQPDFMTAASPQPLAENSHVKRSGNERAYTSHRRLAMADEIAASVIGKESICACRRCHDRFLSRA